MKRFLLAIAAGFAFAPFLALAQNPHADEEQVFKGEVTRWGDTVQHVAGDERSSDEPIGDVMGVPPDDNHKWFISVVGSKGCGACARLKADIRADQATQKNLGAFITLMEGDDMHSDPKTSWSHYNYFYSDDKSQAFRFEKLGITAYPTILVQPPLNKKFGDPATVVFKREGYDGDGAKLVRDMSAAIKRYVAKQSERKVDKSAALPPPPRSEVASSIGGAFGQRDGDPDWVVPPKVDPTPAPAPNVLPNQIPPPDVKPAPTPDARPVNPDAHDAPPEAVIVYDKNALNTDEQDRRLAQVVERLRAAGKILRVRQIDYRDAPELDVPRDQLPAVVVTAEGRVIDRLTDRLLPSLVPPVEAPREIGLADIPWSVIITLLSGGGISLGGIAAIGWFAFKAIRAFRAARGQQLLVDEATLAQFKAMFDAYFKPKEPAK
jgi:hypothetical protein